MHELCADGAAVNILQPVDDLPEREGFFLKIRGQNDFVLKRKKKRDKNLGGWRGWICICTKDMR